jgi:hypothetical protein
MDHLRAAYRRETVSFPWQKGDLLMLDNMLVAHARDPFSGPRRVLVGMAEAVDREQVLLDSREGRCGRAGAQCRSRSAVLPGNASGRPDACEAPAFHL